MPLDGNLHDWEWEDSRPPRLIGCFVVAPISRHRWRLDQLTYSGWVSLCCFIEKGGVRQARIIGGCLMRQINDSGIV
jgi:hypothetical protein